MGVEAGEDDDGELDALGGVDRHDAHGVVVLFGDDGLDDLGVGLGLVLGPVEELAESGAVVVAEGAGLVEEESVAGPVFAGLALDDGELHQASLADRVADEFADGHLPALGGGLVEPAHGVGDGIVVGDVRRPGLWR